MEDYEDIVVVVVLLNFKIIDIEVNMVIIKVLFKDKSKIGGIFIR